MNVTYSSEEILPLERLRLTRVSKARHFRGVEHCGTARPAIKTFKASGFPLESHQM